MHQGLDPKANLQMPKEGTAIGRTKFSFAIQHSIYLYSHYCTIKMDALIIVFLR